MACQPVKQLPSELSERALYQNSIYDAMAPTMQEVSNDLVAIHKDNQELIWETFDGEDYLLMLTWKSNISYYKDYAGNKGYYDTKGYPIWVTTAPELLNRMKKEKATDVDMRLKQLLGLPPSAVYSHFVEIWVKPEDLFRPCPDSNIDDSSCDLCFPAETDSLHRAWINENRVSRYYAEGCKLEDAYPWTQLGYTYDWNPDNPSHIGLSEFVIRKNKKVKIKAIYTTKEYLGL